MTPRKLTGSAVDDTDPEPGVILLYDAADGDVRYVTAAEDARQVLRTFIGDYRYFAVDHTYSTDEARREAVRLFHRHGGTELLDNEEHPAQPEDKCPVCRLSD